MKLFKQWWYKSRGNYYKQKRAQLAHNFIFSKPIFSEQYGRLTRKMNDLRFLEPIDIEYPMQYGKHQ